MSDFIGNAAGISTRWLTEEVFKLIDLVQRDEAIYNPRHKYYFCRPYVENFWREVDQKLDKNPGASLAKWTNLRISFRREFTNYLEEKVPPCWSYFDRMFFLHPYLRKKQYQTTKGETLQDAIAQIGELSNRLERQAADKANKSNSSLSGVQLNASNSFNQQHSNPDTYFDYYDEPEPNNSELEEIIDEEHRYEAARYPQVILETPGLSQHKIKSETEDDIAEDEYEKRHEILLDGDIGEDLPSSPPISSHTIGRPPKRSHSSYNQQQTRLEQLNRLQNRNTRHEDFSRAKRPRSQERLLGNIASNSTNGNSQRSTAAGCSSNSANVSFVRPTVSKSNDAASTLDATISSAASTSLAAQASTSSSVTQPSTHSARYYSQRFDTSSSNIFSNASTSNVNPQTARQNLSPASTSAAPGSHVELCDCKTDPDAMFLMSLLPDIQKLNGRDRGKIKIAFQNILQDYLYPD